MYLRCNKDGPYKATKDLYCQASHYLYYVPMFYKQKYGFELSIIMDDYRFRTYIGVTVSAQARFVVG